MHTSCRHTRRRSGTTIVEVIVALVLLSVGVLAVAGSSATAMRATAVARLEAAAVARASDRAARLLVLGCNQPQRGSQDSIGVRESWAVSPTAAGTALIDVRVEWRSGGALHTFALATANLC